MKSVAAFAALALPAFVAAGAIVNPNKLPHKSESGQTGYNDCQNYPDSSRSQCQTAYINGPDDWCVFSGPYTAPIGDIEEKAVSYCTKPGHGARLIPKGALKTSHFVQTPHYVQITGVGDLTKLHIPKGDEGGELDPHGATGVGNPVGSLVIGKDPRSGSGGKLIQYAEWTNFMAADEFCIRACFPGPEAAKYCQHIYDIEGCYWNMPAKYEEKGFDGCLADDVEPMGVYGKSTYTRGKGTEPAPHPTAKSSQCKTVTSLGNASYPPTSSVTKKAAIKKAAAATATPKAKRHHNAREI